MKKVVINFLVFLVLIGTLFLLCACSSKPVYKSKEEIIEIVHKNYGDDYKLEKELKYPDDTEEKNEMYEYVFKNSKGNSFSVYSSTGHLQAIDSGGDTAFYTAQIHDNYIEKKISDNKEAIEELFSSNNLNVECYESNYKMGTVTLNDINDVEKLAKVIYQIQKILDIEKNILEEGSNIYKFGNSASLDIYLQSEKDNTKKAFCFYNITNETLEENDIKDKIEYDLIDYIYRFEYLQYFDIPENMILDFKNR